MGSRPRFQATRWLGDAVLLRVLGRKAGRPEVGVGERDDADDDRAPRTPRSTSAHIGRTGKPKLCRWRRLLTSNAMIARQPMMPRTQVRSPPIEPAVPPPMRRKVPSKPRYGGAAGQQPHRPAQGQEAAERDDEGGDADIGDDEALEATDERPETEPQGEGDDPRERVVQPEPRPAATRSGAARRPSPRRRRWTRPTGRCSATR